MSVNSHHSLQTVGWHKIKNLKESTYFDVSATDSWNALNDNQTDKTQDKKRSLGFVLKKKTPQIQFFLKGLSVVTQYLNSLTSKPY